MVGDKKWIFWECREGNFVSETLNIKLILYLTRYSIFLMKKIKICHSRAGGNLGENILFGRKRCTGSPGIPGQPLFRFMKFTSSSPRMTTWEGENKNVILNLIQDFQPFLSQKQHMSFRTPIRNPANKQIPLPS